MWALNVMKSASGTCKAGGFFQKWRDRERQVILLNCKVMAQMSVPPVPVPGGDEDHLFEKITLQHSWYLSGHFLWNPGEWPSVTVAGAVTARAKWQLFARVPSPQSSVLCFAGLLISASSPPCGRENFIFPTVQQPGTQCRESGLLLTKGVLNVSIIKVFRGKWRRAFLAHGLAVCCIGKRMAPGHGSGKRLLCGGVVQTAGHSTLGSWRTGREVPRQWW